MNLELPNVKAKTTLMTPTSIRSPEQRTPRGALEASTVGQANAVKYRRMLRDKRHATETLTHDWTTMESTARKETEATGRGSTVSQYGHRFSNVNSEYQHSTQVCSPRLQHSEALADRGKPFNARDTIPRSTFNLPHDLSQIEKTDELACETENEDPFQVADEIELVEKDTLFVPTIGMLDLPEADRLSNRHSRNASPRHNRGSMPAEQSTKPQLTLGEALDDYLQRCKSPENYLTMKGKMDFIHQARILKCENTIRKCRLE